MSDLRPIKRHANKPPDPATKTLKIKPPYVLRCQQYGEFLYIGYKAKVGFRKTKAEASIYHSFQSACKARGHAEFYVMRLFDVVSFNEA